jgi:hypothetical protein
VPRRESGEPSVISRRSRPAGVDGVQLLASDEVSPAASFNFSRFWCSVDVGTILSCKCATVGLVEFLKRRTSLECRNGGLQIRHSPLISLVMLWLLLRALYSATHWFNAPTSIFILMLFSPGVRAAFRSDCDLYRSNIESRRFRTLNCFASSMRSSNDGSFMRMRSFSVVILTS